MNKYQCIKFFETKYDYYGKDYGNGGMVNEGDIYIVIYPVINHKDENPLNNNVNNLEWCSSSYNNTYNDIHIKNGIKRRGRPSHNKMKTIKKYQNKEILMLSKEGFLLKTFNTVGEAANYISNLYNKKYETTMSKIWEVIHNKYETYLGFMWKMKDKENNSMVI